MPLDLPRLVRDVAVCIQRIDARQPQASSGHDETFYQPGIGPHTEMQAVSVRRKLVIGSSSEEVRR